MTSQTSGFVVLSDLLGINWYRYPVERVSFAIYLLAFGRVLLKNNTLPRSSLHLIIAFNGSEKSL
jgi:hypothetical protein